MTSGPTALRVAVDGELRATSGIGVIQRAVYPRLRQRGAVLLPGAARDGHGTRAGAARSLVTALARPVPPADVQLALTSPLPLRMPHPVVSFVHDLRWRTTRGAAARAYREWDLRRLLRASDQVLTVSERTRDDLCSFTAFPPERVHVVHLGPGVLGAAGEAVPACVPGRVLLVGAASHKRNELAASALAQARPAWLDSVTGIGVSDQVRQVLEDALGAGRCRWLSGLSDAQMECEYRAAAVFVLLSTSEGFGLPYVEAAAAGAHVVAVRQPLTEELLAGAPVTLLEDGPLDVIAAQLGTLEPASTGTAHARWRGRFSWDRTTDEVEAAVRGAQSRRGQDS